MDRRHFLATVGAVAVAGCVGSDDAADRPPAGWHNHTIAGTDPVEIGELAAGDEIRVDLAATNVSQMDVYLMRGETAVARWSVGQDGYAGDSPTTRLTDGTTVDKGGTYRLVPDVTGAGDDYEIHVSYKVP